MRAIFTEEFHPVFYETLDSKGIKYDVKHGINYSALKDIIHQYDILIVNSKVNIDREMIDAAQKLKIIGRVGSGLDIIDLQTCAERGIKVLSSPEGNANAVAEHTLGAIIGLMKNIFRANDEMSRDIWKREENRGEEIYGKVFGIIGYGHVGQRLAKLLQGFDAEVIIYDIKKFEELPKYVRQVEMSEFYKNAEIVSLHIPLNESTRYFADDKFFNSFKNEIVFANTSRGKIVDTLSLLRALKSNKLKSAIIDVFEEEPLVIGSEEMKEMMQNHKLVCTPHIAGWSHRSKYELSKILVDKILCNL